MGECGLRSEATSSFFTISLGAVVSCASSEMQKKEKTSARKKWYIRE
jgi:hypothetical protein